MNGFKKDAKRMCAFCGCEVLRRGRWGAYKHCSPECDLASMARRVRAQVKDPEYRKRLLPRWLKQAELMRAELMRRRLERFPAELQDAVRLLWRLNAAIKRKGNG